MSSKSNNMKSRWEDESQRKTLSESMRNANEERRRRVRSLVRDGKKYQEILDETGMTPQGLDRIIKRESIKVDGDTLILNKNRQGSIEEDVSRLVDKGLTPQEIASLVDMDFHYINKIIKKHGLEANRIKRKKKESVQRKNIAVQLYESGEPIESISSSIGISEKTIRAYLIDAGFSIPRKIPCTSNPERDAKIIELRKLNMHNKDIAAALNLPSYTVNQVVWKNGLVSRRLELRRGYKLEHNYVIVKLNQEDPYYEMARKDGSIFEHRVVMARHLGRALREEESVHHIDGNKRNNSIENLELRQGKHGKGVSLCCGKCGSIDVRPVPLGYGQHHPEYCI